MAVIIYPPTINWNWMTQRVQQLMVEFAKHGHEVYYCNKKQLEYPLMKRETRNLRIVHNNKKFIRNVVPLLKKQGKKIIVWTTCAKQYLFVDQYFPDVVVYDYVDDFPRWAAYVPQMVERSDIVFTSAKHLKLQMDHYFPYHPSHVIPNAANLELFMQNKNNEAPPLPPEFESHDGPIIVYSGAWAHWLDHQLVNEVALAFPNALISIIGAVFSERAEISAPNIRFIGLKPHQELPNYLYYADACIIPFKRNRITNATNPVKMYEYLAAGKPVVSTELPETKNVPYVYNAKNADEFIAHLEHVLSPDFDMDQHFMESWLKGHSWNRRFRDIEKILDFYFPHVIANDSVTTSKGV